MTDDDNIVKITRVDILQRRLAGVMRERGQAIDDATTRLAAHLHRPATQGFRYLLMVEGEEADGLVERMRERCALLDGLNKAALDRLRARLLAFRRMCSGEGRVVKFAATETLNQIYEHIGTNDALDVYEILFGLAERAEYEADMAVRSAILQMVGDADDSRVFRWMDALDVCAFWHTYDA